MTFSDIPHLASESIAAHIEQRYPASAGKHDPALLLAAAKAVGKKIRQTPGLGLSFVTGEVPAMGDAIRFPLGNGETTRAAEAVDELFGAAYSAAAAQFVQRMGHC